MKREKERIAKLDYILTGSITVKHGPCGKSGCRCANDKKYWHGPYYIWTRKEKGKTVTQSLSESQVEFCKKAIDNMQMLKTQIEKWKQKSVTALKKR
jgi:hypothetical protein